ncbi:MAG TPA: hypothetical protein VMU59_14840 [Caulobacteraceae bacterium]|nr:hypothetical protein [Caulobacteraceae bacterium]
MIDRQNDKPRACRGRLLLGAGTAALLVVSSAAQAAEPAKGGWILHEFIDPAGPPLAAAEAFINDQCGPSSLDGVQLLAVQPGHESNINLHIYCRVDHAPGVHYALSLQPMDKTKFDAGVLPVLDRPGVRIGPFYFGQNGKGDGFVLVEKTH